jgi:hypothetical protein
MTVPPDEPERPLYFVKRLGRDRLVHVVRAAHTPTDRIAHAGEVQWVLDAATGYRLAYCGREFRTGPTGLDSEQTDVFDDADLCPRCHRVFIETHGDEGVQLLFEHAQPGEPRVEF